MSGPILIIEDDEHKLLDLVGCVGSVIRDEIPVRAASVQAAIERLSAQEFGIILLDMSLPSHTVSAGESPASPMLSGGLEVLMELAYREREDKVIVITQYPEIEIEGTLVRTEKSFPILQNVLYGGVIGVIRYDRRSDQWSQTLRELLGERK